MKQEGLINHVIEALELDFSTLRIQMAKLHMVLLATIVSWECCFISLVTNDQILHMLLTVLHKIYSVQDILMNLH